MAQKSHQGDQGVPGVVLMVVLKLVLVPVKQVPVQKEEQEPVQKEPGAERVSQKVESIAGIGWLESHPGSPMRRVLPGFCCEGVTPEVPGGGTQAPRPVSLQLESDMWVKFTVGVQVNIPGPNEPSGLRRDTGA